MASFSLQVRGVMDAAWLAAANAALDYAAPRPRPRARYLSADAFEPARSVDPHFLIISLHLSSHSYSAAVQEL
jgi:hypothetical protein